MPSENITKNEVQEHENGPTMMKKKSFEYCHYHCWRFIFQIQIKNIARIGCDFGHQMAPPSICTDQMSQWIALCITKVKVTELVTQ